VKVLVLNAHSGSPVADRQEVLGKERIPLNGIDRCNVCVEYTRHFLGQCLSFAITQPNPTALRTHHELLRLNTRNQRHDFYIALYHWRVYIVGFAAENLLPLCGQCCIDLARGPLIVGGLTGMMPEGPRAG